MKEPLTIQKLMRDIARPPQNFFGPDWDAANSIDIARAKQLHEEASHKVCFNPSCHICDDRERKERTEKQSADIRADERYIDSLLRR